MRNAQPNARISWKRLERSLAARFLPALNHTITRQAEVTYSLSHLHLRLHPQHLQGQQIRPRAVRCTIPRLPAPTCRQLLLYLRISSQKIRSTRRCTDHHAIFPISSCSTIEGPTPPAFSPISTSSSSRQLSHPFTNPLSSLH